MKKFLPPLFTLLLLEANAQCPVLVNGQGNGASFNICAGSCFTYGLSGTQTYTWVPAGNTVPTGTICPSVTTTYTVMGTSSGGTCTDTNIFTLYVSPNPTLTTSSSSSTICSGSTTTLSCMGAMTYTWAPGGYTGNPYVVSPTSTTVYTVCADMAGCVSCSSIVVNVNPTPSVTFSLTNTAPQVWDAVPVYSGGTTPYTYQWSWGDGSPNDVIAYPSHTYTTAGWYNVCVTLTDANGCFSNYCSLDSLYKPGSAMISLNVVTGSSGITAHSKNPAGFSPNPASEQLVIEEGYTAAEIFDISGKMVLNRKITGKTTLNISHLPEGIYFLRLKSGEVVSSKKLVIAR